MNFNVKYVHLHKKKNYQKILLDDTFVCECNFAKVNECKLDARKYTKKAFYT